MLGLSKATMQGMVMQNKLALETQMLAYKTLILLILCAYFFIIYFNERTFNFLLLKIAITYFCFDYCFL